LARFGVRLPDIEALVTLLSPGARHSADLISLL
jgi:hypothetical protein